MNAPEVKAAMSEIDRQLGAALKDPAPAPTAHSLTDLQDAPRVVPPPTDVRPRSAAAAPSQPRFQAVQETFKDTISALNSLDMVHLLSRDTQLMETKAERDAGTLSAFIAIAHETSMRAHFALDHIAATMKSAEQAERVDQHNLLAWVANQKILGEHHIQLEEARIAKMQDQVNGLQHIYQDAVAKERSYQVQVSQLVSERQLQFTPPIMPAVQAATLTDEEYNNAILKLRHYQSMAQQIMQQTAASIADLDHQIQRSTEWVRNAKAVIAAWEERNMRIIQARHTFYLSLVDKARRQMDAVSRIAAEAETFKDAYTQALARANLMAQLADLVQHRHNYEVVEVHDPYNRAKKTSIMEGLQLQIDEIKARLNKLPDGQVVAPPPTWGVLASFRLPPGTHYHLNTQPLLGVGYSAVHVAPAPTAVALAPPLMGHPWNPTLLQHQFSPTMEALSFGPPGSTEPFPQSPVSTQLSAPNNAAYAPRVYAQVNPPIAQIGNVWTGHGTDAYPSFRSSDVQSQQQQQQQQQSSSGGGNSNGDKRGPPSPPAYPEDLPAPPDADLIGA